MSEKKDMYYNFDMIMPRLIDSFDHLDTKKANNILGNIERNCICMGTGGSNCTSHFASIVLEERNGIIAVSKEPRDVIHMNLNSKYGYSGKYDTLLGITYGNNNYGIDEAIKRASNHKIEPHLITTNSESPKDICYKGSLPNEHSFISLASTVIPMSILLNYFLHYYDEEKVLELINKMYLNASNDNYDLSFNEETPIFEIMSGDNTYVASKVLESTIAEAGLGIPVVHEKYSYCHGRSTLTFNNNSNLIYLINDKTNLDDLLLAELREMYNSVTILESKESDYIVSEFDLALKSLFLCKSIAKEQEKDLSKVNYSPVVRKLYKYKDGM